MPTARNKPECPPRAAAGAVGVGALALLVSTSLAVACVSPPRPVGPTTLVGTLPPSASGATATATPAAGAVDGPLRLLEPRFAWTHASPSASAYEWSCRIENPSNSDFLVTLVVQLVDIDGRSLESSSQAFRISDEELVPVSGGGQIEADVAARVTDWRLEYWVRVPPRPIR